MVAVCLSDRLASLFASLQSCAVPYSSIALCPLPVPFVLELCPASSLRIAYYCNIMTFTRMGHTCLRGLPFTDHLCTCPPSGARCKHHGAASAGTWVLCCPVMRWTVGSAGQASPGRTGRSCLHAPSFYEALFSSAVCRIDRPHCILLVTAACGCGGHLAVLQYGSNLCSVARSVRVRMPHHSSFRCYLKCDLRSMLFCVVLLLLLRQLSGLYFT